MKQFRVSVIMGVYNCEKTIRTSLDSLLNQTYQDFNIIICDDGSTDGTYSIVEEYTKVYSDKFILLKNDKNMGLNYTLNKCLEHANSEYIARMDGDDISLPTRFSKEVEFLDNNKRIDIVSCSMVFFDETGEWGLSKTTEYPQIADLIKGTPFPHAPSMVRRKAFTAVNGYTDEKRLRRVEDYHLWLKMYLRGFKGYNIQEPLYKMRNDRNAFSRRNFKARLNEAYVKHLIIKELKLPIWNLVYVIRPIIVAILPKALYEYLHRKRLSKHWNNHVVKP